MRQHLLVVDDSCDLGRLAQRRLAACSDLLLLCWVAPDTLEQLRRAGVSRCHALLDVVGGHRRWDQRCTGLMEQTAAAGPRYRGAPWRSVLAEDLFKEAHTVQAVLDAVCRCRELLAQGPATEVRLEMAPQAERIFRAAATGTPALPIAGAEPAEAERPHLAGRLTRRLRHTLLTGGWLTQARNLLAEADRNYRLRLAAGRFLGAPRVAPGGVTFFSSYLNNSRTLKALEPYLRRPVTWVVTNDPARKGAEAERGALHVLWRMAPSASPPAAEPVLDPTFPAATAGGPDAARERARRAWLAGSPTWRYWRRTGRMSLSNLTACWQRYLDVARPRLVVLASQWGVEGWFARLARDRGIPVLQLLHGILGGPFYTERPLVGDAMVVWGDFWRHQRPAPEHPRVHVFNPGVVPPPAAPRKPAVRPRLTYFSWPFDRLPFYNDRELLDSFIDLFQDLLDAESCELTVRAHPLENLSDLTQRWRRRRGALPRGLRLSQRQPLAEVLARTDVAVMFRSTVMLDCFAHGIPIVLPGWIDFAWNRSLEGVPGIGLAADLRELRRTLKAWLQEPPRIDRQTVRRFLRPAGEGSAAFAAFLEQLTRPLRRPAAPGEEVPCAR